MNTRSIAHIRQFIADLDVPAPAPSRPTLYRPGARAFQDDSQGAAADAGSLVSFVGGISGLHKSDVLNSTLLAQLAATKKFDRFKQTREWYDYYTYVLANVGWTMPSFVYEQFEPSGSTLVMSDAILEILAAIATADEMVILAATLSALRDNADNEGALTVFSEESFPENIGTFQVFPVAEDRGDVVMALAAMQFTANRHEHRFLWFKWSTYDVKLFRSAQKGVLNEDVYSQVRAEVIEKLGDNARNFIRDIEI